MGGPELRPQQQQQVTVGIITLEASPEDGNASRHVVDLAL